MATPDQIPSDLALEVAEDLPPNEFMAAARHFFGFVDEVARSITPDGEPVRWVVKVREGSALLGAVAPLNEPPEVLSAIYARTRSAVDGLESGTIEGAGLTDAALGHLKGLSDLSQRRKDRPVHICFWVERKPKVIGPEISRVIQEEWQVNYNDYGTIEGRLEAIQDRSGLQISVRDPLFKQVVKCYLTDGLLDRAFDSFRKRVEVSGLIHYRRNGTPISIEASDLTALPDDSDLPSASDVRGILSSTSFA